MPSHLRRYDIPGHVHFWTITCFHRLGFFQQPDLKQIVVDSLRLLQDKHRVCLIGYVIMPEHVHILLYPHEQGCEEPISISRLLGAFKQHVGYYSKEKLRQYWRRFGQLWSGPLNEWALGKLGEQKIWTPRGHDFNVDRQETLLQKLDYCHKNPITRGLVERADDWVWSSHRYYELEDDSILRMDWDGAWPIVW